MKINIKNKMIALHKRKTLTMIERKLFYIFKHLNFEATIPNYERISCIHKAYTLHVFEHNQKKLCVFFYLPVK